MPKGFKMRSLGEIMLDLEPLILEMVEQQEMQYSDVLGIIFSYMEVHCPNAREKYMDGTSPIYFYGPREEFKKRDKKRKK